MRSTPPRTACRPALHALSARRRAAIHPHDAEPRRRAHVVPRDARTPRREPTAGRQPCRPPELRRAGRVCRPLLPLPAERGLFAQLLHHGALDAAGGQRADADQAGAAIGKRPVDPWRTGRASPALASRRPFCRRKAGLRFCGHLFKPCQAAPKSATAAEQGDGSSAPTRNVGLENAPSREPWVLLFWLKLRDTLGSDELQDLSDQLLLFYCDHAPMPLLMYMPAFGHRADGHPGMLYEVGPPSAQPQSPHPDFVVRALIPCGQQAFARLCVYASNPNAACLATAAALRKMSRPTRRRREMIFRASGTKPASCLVYSTTEPPTSRPIPDSSRHGVLKSRGAACARPTTHTADVMALCGADLAHISEGEWGSYQLYVAPPLDGLPGVLTRHFEFGARARSLWGYRMTSALDVRDDAEAHAAKSMKSVYRRNGDGDARRARRGGSAATSVGSAAPFQRKDFQRDDEPPVLTLLSVLRCPPRSTASGCCGADAPRAADEFCVGRTRPSRPMARLQAAASRSLATSSRFGPRWCGHQARGRRPCVSCATSSRECGSSTTATRRCRSTFGDCAMACG